MSDYPELPELSDETLEAIIAYGVFWLHYSEKSEADAAIRLTENLRRPTESVEEWEERVPSYLQRQALRPSQVEDAAKRIREENATQQKWRFFSEPFRNQLQEQRRQRERAAFEEVRANVEVVAEPVRASEAYAALEASPLDPKSDWGATRPPPTSTTRSPSTGSSWAMSGASPSSPSGASPGPGTTTSTTATPGQSGTTAATATACASRARQPRRS